MIFKSKNNANKLMSILHAIRPKINYNTMREVNLSIDRGIGREKMIMRLKRRYENENL